MEHQNPTAGHWSSMQLLAFRLTFTYLILYNLPFPFGAFPHTVKVAQGYESLWLKLVPWVGKHVLGLDHEIITSTNCSGDTTYDYVRVLCYVTFSVAATVLWSLLDRHRSDHKRLYEWLRCYVRLSVGSTILMYGAAKVFLMHFPPPNLSKLLEPLGEYSRMGLLWTFTGSSRGYSQFAGWVQIFNGMLFFIPRLTMLGALVGIAVFSNIFVLNLGYDLPVKLYSLHVLLICFFLALPDARRLVNFFLLNRSVAPNPETALFNRRRLNFAALVAQLMLGGFLVCSHLYQTYAYEKRNFDTATRPPLYGIWVVDEFVLGGKLLPPLLTDESRWQRMVFEFPKKVRIQSMNGSWTGYELGEDTVKKTLTMQKPNDPGKGFDFAFSNPAPQSLILQGIGGGNEIRVNLHRLDERQFALLARGLHWIDEDADLVMDEERVCDRIKPGDRALRGR